MDNILNLILLALLAWAVARIADLILDSIAQCWKVK